MRPCGETMYSRDHRKGLGMLATIFVLLVPIQQFFVLLVPIQQLFPFYHNQQSRGITGLLDKKRLLFALSLKRRTGHNVNPQPFDCLSPQHFQNCKPLPYPG